MRSDVLRLHVDTQQPASVPLPAYPMAANADNAIRFSVISRTSVEAADLQQVDEAALNAWEDALDSLGSQPSLVDLRRLLSDAPSRTHELFVFAQGVYNERLAIATTAWEDELDALGSNPSSEDLSRLLAEAPDPQHPTAVFASGVLAQRFLALAA